MVRLASDCGSVRWVSMLVSACRFTCSNSDSGNDGSRSISATIASDSAQVRAHRLDRRAVDADRRVAARRRSSASFSSARLRFCVPRESIALATEQALPRFVFAASSPQRRASCATTVPPRVFFGSSVSFMPEGSVRRMMRASMFCGVGSNASPAATSDAPAKPFRIAATSGAGGHVRRARACRRDRTGRACGSPAAGRWSLRAARPRASPCRAGRGRGRAAASRRSRRTRRA